MSGGVQNGASAQELRIAKVAMPENGVYLVKVVDPSACMLRPGDKAIVSLDYGEDECKVLEVRGYDSGTDGARPPSYRLVRPFGAEDAAAAAAFVGEAARLAERFAGLARREAPDFHVVYSRLAIGRGKLFLRYVSSRPRAAVPRAIAEAASAVGVPVNAWQMGIRDAMAALGGVGPCGRVCCCAGWMRHSSGPRADSGAHAPAGACGRTRCCAAFEAKEANAK